MGVSDDRDMRTVEESLEYEDVKTTTIYTHLLNRGGKGVNSPVDDVYRITAGVLSRNHISSHPKRRRDPNSLYSNACVGLNGGGARPRIPGPKML